MQTFRPYDFMSGYECKSCNKYQNMGYRSSPYPGKQYEGDYAKNQSIFNEFTHANYRPESPVYYPYQNISIYPIKRFFSGQHTISEYQGGQGLNRTCGYTQ
jgi:hypothetical protein